MSCYLLNIEGIGPGCAQPREHGVAKRVEYKGLLLRAAGGTVPDRESLVMRADVVGGNLPSLRVSVIPISTGDLLIFVSDGIAGSFDDGIPIGDPPQKIADEILEAHRKGTERCRGSGGPVHGRDAMKAAVAAKARAAAAQNLKRLVRFLSQPTRPVLEVTA